MEKNIKLKISDTKSRILNFLTNKKTSVPNEDDNNTNTINKTKNVESQNNNSLNISECNVINKKNNDKDTIKKKKKSGTILNLKNEQQTQTLEGEVKDGKANTESITNQTTDLQNKELQNKNEENTQIDKIQNEISSSEKEQRQNNVSDVEYIESLKCEIEENIQADNLQKYESKLNPIAPEFKPQNSFYIYQKIQQHTKKNVLLLIKSFAYKGIKLENISGEYCKKYNALLNLGQAGFTNIYDLLKSIDRYLIFEELKDDSKKDHNDQKSDIKDNNNDDKKSDIKDNNNDDKKSDIKDKNNDDKKSDIKENNNDDKKSDIKENNNDDKKSDIKGNNNDDKKSDIKENNNNNDEENKTSNNNKYSYYEKKSFPYFINKNNISEKNIIIKYKTPHMDEDRKFFIKIILGTLSECTNYNSKLSDEDTNINNSVSLTKLPQEVKKIFGSSFNLKSIQIRCGIDKLQTFLEEIQEIQIFTLQNDMKIRITPETYNHKIPQLNFIMKSLTSHDLKTKSSFKLLFNKKNSLSMPVLDKQFSLDNNHSTEHPYNMYKNNSFDNFHFIKSLSSNELKNNLFSFNKKKMTSSNLFPQKSWKGILFGEKNKQPTHNKDLHILNKLNYPYNKNNSTIFNNNNNNYYYNHNQNNSNFIPLSNDVLNSCSLNKLHSNNNDYSNKNYNSKILTKMQLHILLYQLIVILSERQKIEWTQINKIKDQILHSNIKSCDLQENDENQVVRKSDIGTYKNQEDDANQKETFTDNNASLLKSNSDLLHFINTSGTHGSSEYQLESQETHDTTNLFKSENLSSDKYTKNSDFFNSFERNNTNVQFIGVFVSTIKSEWNKTYAEQYPLSFYLNYYKTKKLRKLLEEIPNLIIAGYGRIMQVFTLDAAQDYYDNLFTDNKQENLKTFSKSKFTTLSNSPYFKDITYQDVAKACAEGESVNVLDILGGDNMNVAKQNSNKYYDNFIYGLKRNDDFYNADKYGELKKNYNYEDMDMEMKNSYCYPNENVEILRYHLHKLLYNLVIHVCKKQNTLFLKYKANGVILSEYEMNKQLCGPVFYSSDLSYEDFITSRKINFFEKQQIKNSVYLLSQHGIYGIKFIHLSNEWFKLYNCELRPLMKICHYQKIGQMICNMPNVYVVGDGFDMKYIPNTEMDNEANDYNDVLSRKINKMSSENLSYNNKMNYNRISQDMPTKITNKNMAYESIMGLLFPNIRSHKSCNVNAYYKDHNDYRKNKTIMPEFSNAYSFKNDIRINNLFKNM
ncbi:hypothetical protein PGSY75_0515600 [Plasmodium gaboni]|uniref:HTH OST-type domain-containing protein n=1 Tax=Plasmodium gaboni TaxID=647221 RepID=A0A151LT61_9APIC|nr:hypothetical protein PGSY75_0515600 [Plasmodium gaboni]KYO02351.1 hypothetical protein PGSY75_0515600 [Plasmodium gaboni]